MAVENPVGLNPIRDYIDNQVLTPMVRLSASIRNANNDAPLQEQHATSAGYLNQALESATRVHRSGAWRQLPADDRIARLEHIAQLLESRLDDIAGVESLTTGVIIKQSRALGRLLPLAFRQAAANISQATRPLVLSPKVSVERPPWGPAVVITPWNNGAVTAAHKVASALAAGCPVILKPSEWSPFACDLMAQTIAQAQLPPGTFQLVHGGEDVGKLLIGDPRTRAVAFTGTLASGREVAQTCAHDFTPLQLELGGVNPAIVLEDADLDETAEGIVSALTFLNGQWNRGLGRLLVHRNLYNKLLRSVLDRLEQLTIGDSLLPDSEMGPLINHEHGQKIQALIDKCLRSGGVMHEAGHLPDLPGYFVKPALITNCPPDQSLEELFAPVATVHMFTDDDEALTLANQPRAAWAAYIFSEDLARARRLAAGLETSSVSINGVSLFGLHPAAPRSTWGRTGRSESSVTESIRFFSGTRSIGMA